jgi:hypothetical protein
MIELEQTKYMQSEHVCHNQANYDITKLGVLHCMLNTLSSLNGDSNTILTSYKRASKLLY